MACRRNEHINAKVVAVATKANQRRLVPKTYSYRYELAADAGPSGDPIVRAGAAIAAQAGAAVKKTVLELGGSDAFIVLRDADLKEAVAAAVSARFQNTGQVCIAAKRIILDRPIAEEFTTRLTEAVQALTIGEPLNEATYIGPMARYDLRDELHLQVQKTVAEGARLVLGGDKLPGPGNYFAPTVLGDVTPTMTAFREETFGPVASLIVAQDARMPSEATFSTISNACEGTR